MILRVMTSYDVFQAVLHGAPFTGLRVLSFVPMGERQSIAQKGVRAIDTRIHSYEMAQMLQKRVFVLPGCQRMGVNTLL